LIAKNPPRSKKSYAGTIDEALTNHSAAFWLIMAGMALRNVAEFGAMALLHFPPQPDHDPHIPGSSAHSRASVVAALCRFCGGGSAILSLFSNGLFRFKLLFNPAPVGRQSSPLL
jgi:hypothetical protein